jgi:predicted homoserine dehydrogenase-like protein
MVEDAEVARREQLIPIGLTQGAVVREPVPEDGLITDANVKLECGFALQLRKKAAKGANIAPAKSGGC